MGKYNSINDAVRAKIDELVEEKGLDKKDYLYTADVASSLNQLASIMGGSGDSMTIADSLYDVLDSSVGAEDDYYKFMMHTLEDIIVPEGVTLIIDNLFSGFFYAKSLKIADSVNTIGAGSFSALGAENRGIDFPVIMNGVKKINCDNQNATFFNAAITSVVLPSIEEIGYGAFSNNPLRYLYLGPNCKTIRGGAFAAVPITCKVECGFAEGTVSGFPDGSGFAGNPADLDITYNVPAPTEYPED